MEAGKRQSVSAEMIAALETLRQIASSEGPYDVGAVKRLELPTPERRLAFIAEVLEGALAGARTVR